MLHFLLKMREVYFTPKRTVPYPNQLFPALLKTTSNISRPKLRLLTPLSLVGLGSESCILCNLSTIHRANSVKDSLQPPLPSLRILKSLVHSLPKSQVMIEEEELNCQLRLLQGSDKESEKVLTLGEYIGDIEAPAIPASIFLLWARNIAQTFSKELEAGHAIRSWDFHLRLDGSTHLLPYEIKPDTKDSLALTKTTYPVRYCMPLRDNLSDDSANFLSASFVLGSLLYEVVIGAKPYEEVGSEEIRSRYAGNEFPDILSQRLGPIIRGCWMGTYHDTSKVVEDIDSMIGKGKP